MCAKVYVLLDIIDGNCDQAIGILQNIPGVVAVDIVEGPPDIVFVVEAGERQCLAELTISALELVESTTAGIQLLPTLDNYSNNINTNSTYSSRSNEGKKLYTSKRSALGGG